MSEANTPKQKSQGPIRWNAIIPFAIISLICYLYFLLFFDLHMKNAIEWLGYKTVGAEVNVGQFKSSFLKGNIQISKIEITDKETPDFNSLELGTIKFDLNWNALLRLKFVVEEIGMEGIQFMSKRSHRGRVAPPEPPSNEPSFVEKLSGKAINKLEKENENNVLGDTAQFLKTGKFDQQIENLQAQLVSKKLMDEMSLKWKTKQSTWNNDIKKLPSSQEINNLKERFTKIKYKDFSSLDELNVSIKETESLKQDIDSKSVQVSELKKQLDADLKSFDQDYKAVELQIKKDIDTIKSRFQIPKIDAASFAKELFMGYLAPYMQKLDKYKALAQKYLPPKYAKMVAGEKTKKIDETIQPLPRAQGVSYEFPIKNGYPLFWIQNIKISSVANAQVDYGDIQGLITDVTSNQHQVGKPTKLNIAGKFTKLKLQGLKLNALFDNMNDDPIVKFNFDIGSYPIENLKLLDSKDGHITVPQTNSTFESSGEIIGFKNYDLKLVNTFNEVSFEVGAKDATLSEVLKTTFGGITKFDLQASAKGELKDLALDIRSSLGGDLENAFNNLLQNKIKEANEKVQLAVNTEIDKLKVQLNSQINGIKNQVQTEVSKVQVQIDEQKKQAEEKIAMAKKDFEDKVNKAKKDAEDQAKKKLEQEAKKQAEELKKKLGL